MIDPLTKIRRVYRTTALCEEPCEEIPQLVACCVRQVALSALVRDDTVIVIREAGLLDYALEPNIRAIQRPLGLPAGPVQRGREARVVRSTEAVRLAREKYGGYADGL